MNRKIHTTGILWLFVFSSCAALYKKKIPEAPIIPELKWDLDSYAEFVNQNMTEITARYSSDYVSYEFVVDNESGFRVFTKTRFTRFMRTTPKKEKELNSHRPTQTHANRAKNLSV